MSMYLPNDDVGPTGAEAAEFIDVPEPDVEAEGTEGSDGASRETDEAFGGQEEPAGMETDAGD
jgi:hypothetical protein